MKTIPTSHPKSLVHLTLNSGHSLNALRSTVSKPILDGFASIVTQKSAPPFVIPWDIALRVDAARQFAVFTLSKSIHCIVTCVLSFGSNDEHPWQLAMDKYQLDVKARQFLGDVLPSKPLSIPWLTTQMHLGIMKIPAEEVSVLGISEQYLAWAIMQEYQR